MRGARGMGLAGKLAAGFGVLLAVMGGLAVHQLLVLDRLQSAAREISHISFATLQTASDLKTEIGELAEFSRKFAVLRDRAYAAELGRIRSEVEVSLARLRAVALSSAESDRLSALEAKWRGYADSLPALESEILSGRAGTADYSRGAEAIFAELQLELSELIRSARAAMSERVAAGDTLVRRSARAAWIGTVAALALAVLVSAAIIRSLSRPVRELVRGTREVAAGNFAHRVPPAGGPELAEVAESFNEMALRLGELDRLKRDFVSNVSHDLKAPLSSMLEGSRLLLDGLRGPLTPEQEKLLRLNLRSGERLSAMIRNLLQLARLDAGVVDYQFEPLDMRELTRQALAEMQVQIEERRLSLHEEYAEQPVMVAGDSGHLMQVLSNLLSNAVKFTPEGGKIGVRVQPVQSGERARVEVWDTGPGIEPADRERIFERFQRGAANDRRTEGTGLGLAIVRSIVADHGGEVGVEARQGGGSVFAVSLPMTEAAAAKGAEGGRARAVVAAARRGTQ